MIAIYKKPFRLSLLVLTSAMLTFCSYLHCAAKLGVRDFIGRDDGALNTSFASFRKTLSQAINERDKITIEQILSPQIDTTIGGARGIDAFEQLWQGLDDDSKFWAMARKILGHGAQFDRESNEFHAPAVSFEDSHSDFPQGIVWSKNALLYSRPDSTASSKNAVYNEQITIVEPKEHKPLSLKWLKIKTRLGTTGYMKADDVYSSFDDFAVFKNENGKWQMTWFGYADL
jgi:hypothetical protein